MKRYYLELDGLTVYIEVKMVRSMRLRITERGVFLSVRPGTDPEACRSFLRSNREWIDKHLATLKERKSAQPELTRELAHQFIERFKPRFEYWQQRMQLRAGRVTFRLMSSRWGSCNHATRAISINVRLALYPEECTDYIIVHELAHLVHPDHSPRFWALVAEYIPGWKNLRRKLRE